MLDYDYSAYWGSIIDGTGGWCNCYRYLQITTTTDCSWRFTNCLLALIMDGVMGFLRKSYYIEAAQRTFKRIDIVASIVRP